MNLPDVFGFLDITGVLLNGILGGVIARKKGLDPVGFVFLAIISGLGGGMLRDTLLQAGPPVALIDFRYLLAALIGALLAYFVHFKGRLWGRISLVADALVLGCWAATGTMKTLSLGFGWLPAILLGIITAVGGGMIRDVAVGRIPEVFGGNTLYATGAFIASLEMLVFFTHAEPNLGMLCSTLTGAAICVVARWRKWILPDSTKAGQHLVRTAGSAKAKAKSTLVNRNFKRARRIGRSHPNHHDPSW